MPIKVLRGSIFDSTAMTLVNTVNCVGVMGKGIAKDFKKLYPGMFKDYVSRCQMGLVYPGYPYIYKNSIGLPDIINFPTKEHWAQNSDIEYIERGMGIILKHYKDWCVRSIAIPPLGCGNGGLDWDAVSRIIFSHASKMDALVEVYEPNNQPEVCCYEINP